MATTIALFYASQGIIIPMAEDTAAYALEWICSFHSADVDTGIEIHTMQACIIGPVWAGYVPAGLNNNLMGKLGIIPCPSTAVAGVVYFPLHLDQPSSTASASTLSYNDPTTTGQSSTQTTGALGSNPTPALTSSMVLEDANSIHMDISEDWSSSWTFWDNNPFILTQ